MRERVRVRERERERERDGERRGGRGKGGVRNLLPADRFYEASVCGTVSEAREIEGALREQHLRDVREGETVSEWVRGREREREK